MESESLPLPERKSTPSLIADRLRHDIFVGNIPGGTQLKQSEIAARFRTSIVPVREAFQHLIADGLAIAEQNKGVTVAEATALDFQDICEMRALLEPQALQRSLPHLGAEDYDSALLTLREAASSSSPIQRAHLHWQFHRTLYAKCGRPRLLSAIERLHLSINRYVLPIWADYGLSEHWDESHVDIVNALRSGDLAAAQKMVVDQIYEAEERVLIHLNPMIKGKP